jgi:hypothetical protein
MVLKLLLGICVQGIGLARNGDARVVFGPLGQITVSIPEFLSAGNAIKMRL